MTKTQKPRELKFTTFPMPEGICYVYHMNECSPDVTFCREQKEWHFVEYETYARAIEALRLISGYRKGNQRTPEANVAHMFLKDLGEVE